MAGVRTARRGDKYQGWYLDKVGKRKFFTGTRSKTETKRIAERLEDDHRQIRLRYRPASAPPDKHRCRLFEDVVGEYLAWGRFEGGRKGFPWSEMHAYKRQTHLAWWQARLRLQTLADLDEIYPKVEQALRELGAAGKARKTIANYVEAIGAFCDWCVERKYLTTDPIEKRKKQNVTPLTIRRAMTAQDISRLLKACASHRRLTYETAFLSGLRANELRNLTVDHLDVDRCGLHLDAQWTKNRESGFQPLPASLVHRLVTFAQSGEALQLYKRFHARKNATKKNPLETPTVCIVVAVTRF